MKLQIIGRAIAACLVLAPMGLGPRGLSAQTTADVDVLIGCIESGDAESEECLGSSWTFDVYFSRRAEVYPDVLDRLLDGLETIALTAERDLARNAVQDIASFGRQLRNPVQTLDRLRRIYADAEDRSVRYSALFHASSQPDSASVASLLGEVATDESGISDEGGRSFPAEAVSLLFEMGRWGMPILEELAASDDVAGYEAQWLLADHLLKPEDIDLHDARECFAAVVHWSACSRYETPRRRTLRDYLNASRFDHDVIERALEELADLAARSPDRRVGGAALATLSARGDARSRDHGTLRHLERVYETTPLPEAQRGVLRHVPHHPPPAAARFLGRVAAGELTKEPHSYAFASLAIDGLSRLGEPGQAEIDRLRALPEEEVLDDARGRLEELAENGDEPLDDEMSVARVCFEALSTRPRERSGRCGPEIYALDLYIWQATRYDSARLEAALDTLAAVVVDAWDNHARIKAFVSIKLLSVVLEGSKARLLPRYEWIAQASDRQHRKYALREAIQIADTTRSVELLSQIASGPPDLGATTSVEGTSSVPSFAVAMLGTLGEQGRAELRRLADEGAVRDLHARGTLAGYLRKLDPPSAP